MIHGDEKFFCSVFSNPLRAWILSLLLQEISPQLKKKMEELDCYSLINLNRNIIDEEKCELSFLFNASNSHIIQKVAISYHNKEPEPFFTVNIFESCNELLKNEVTFKKDIKLSKISYRKIEETHDKFILIVFILLRNKSNLVKLKKTLFKLDNIQYETNFFERKWLTDKIILFMNEFVDEEILLYLQRGDWSIGQRYGFVSIADREDRKEMALYRGKLQKLQKLCC